MGFDADVFVDRVDEELICSICTDVLEEAVQVVPCQHLFCRSCLDQWLAVKTKCPVDNQPLTKSAVTAVPRSIQNILSKLNVRCDRCHRVMPLWRYRSHDCFQEILSQMQDYIKQIDVVLNGLQPN